MHSSFRPLPTWWASLACLGFICTELHEQAHIQTGRLLCGAYGPRDFNVWATACGENSWAASAAGPLFTYMVLWSGALVFCRKKFSNGGLIGLLLVFAALPFARVFTAAVGGGDEKVIFSSFLGPAGRWVALVWVIIICVTPVAMVVSRMPRSFLKILPVLLLGPMLLEFALTHNLLNYILYQGFGSTVFFGGTPWLIHVHLLLMLAALIALFRKNFRNFQAEDKAADAFKN
jgi:hypothetical protein